MKETLRTLLLIILPVFALVLSFWLLNYFTLNFEGFASIGILVLAFGVLIWLGQEVFDTKATVLTFLGVFCLLGMIFDGAGNFIYNKPIHLMCPSETSLSREIVPVEDYEGNVAYSHVFSCYADNQEVPAKQFSVYLTIGIRAVEYLLIGSFLLGIFLILNKFRFSKS